jgi:hypothetical protein
MPATRTSGARGSKGDNIRSAASAAAAIAAVAGTGVAGAEAIGLLLLAWTLAAVLFLGLGLLVQRRPRDGLDGFVTALWSGLAAALALLQVWHLAWPVGAAALAVLAALSAAGLARGRAHWRAWLSGPRRRPWAFGLVLAVLILVADRSLGPPLGSDSGGYHLTSVRWSADHALAPGLANLNHRLGYASSHFLHAALLDVGPLRFRSHHAASGLLLGLLLAQLLAQGARVWRERRAADLAAVLLVPAALAQALRPGASSPSPDLAVFVLGAVLGLQLLAFCETREGGLPLVALAAALVTVKLSALGLAAGALAVALRAAPALALPAAAISAAFLLPWMARNVLLTGYAAYPLPGLALAVPWRVPDAERALHLGWIRSWARAPGLPADQVLGGTEWLGPWAQSLLANRIDVLAPLALLAAGATWLALAPRGGTRGLGPALLAPLAGIAFWLATAPDLRFLGASLWLLAAFTAAIAAARSERPGAAAVLALGIAASLAVLAGAARRGALLLRPDPAHGFHPTPQAIVVPFATRSGLVLWVPQEAGNCWYAPLPCTPEPRGDLRLRRPGELGSGFVRDP